MRKWMLAAASSFTLAACGGGGGGGGESSPVSVVPAAPTPTPTPAPTPAPTPTPTPTPTPAPTPTPTPTPPPALTSSYPRYADLTGDQTFQTACASLLTAGSLPTPQSATAFGDGPALRYTAAGDSYAIAGEGFDLTFAPSDLEAGAAGQRVYSRTTGGATQRLAITQPTASGTGLDHVRKLELTASSPDGPALYACVFGIPTTAADRPSAAITYAKFGVDGVAHVSDGGVIRRYTIASSTGTVSYDPSGGMIVRVQIMGALQTASGPAATLTDLGTFEGRSAVEAAGGGFYGQLGSEDRISLFSSFGGGFFGGTQVAAAFQILAADPDSGSRMVVLGTVVAIR